MILSDALKVNVSISKNQQLQLEAQEVQGQMVQHNQQHEHERGLTALSMADTGLGEKGAGLLLQALTSSAQGGHGGGLPGSDFGALAFLDLSCNGMGPQVSCDAMCWYAISCYVTM